MATNRWVVEVSEEVLAEEYGTMSMTSRVEMTPELAKDIEEVVHTQATVVAMISKLPVPKVPGGIGPLPTLTGTPFISPDLPMLLAALVPGTFTLLLDPRARVWRPHVIVTPESNQIGWVDQLLALSADIIVEISHYNELPAVSQANYIANHSM